jgi:hypothetical protein
MFIYLIMLSKFHTDILVVYSEIPINKNISFDEIFLKIQTQKCIYVR